MEFCSSKLKKLLIFQEGTCKACKKSIKTLLTFKSIKTLPF